MGKTGAAIIAADYLMAGTILVITTASGRAVWQRGFAEWSNFGRPLQILTGGAALLPTARVAIVGWGDTVSPKVRNQLLHRHWDVLIADEAHYAKNFGSKRTQALYGELADDGAHLLNREALYTSAASVWPLTGTPMPNSPLDLYPMLRALAPALLRADEAKAWPDVTLLSAFTKRYCKTKPVKIGHGFMARFIDVVIGGRNEAELAARLAGFMLLRTQADVGIRQPSHEIFPLTVSARNRAAADAGLKSREVLAAVNDDDTKSLDMQLGPLRRLTGEIKARAIVEAMLEELNSGLDKIVLAYWHQDVGAILKQGLSKFGVVGIDGSTSAKNRAIAEQQFRSGPPRVFLAQIAAAGESIDLSAAAELLFVETTFLPAQMKQMSLRVTNHTQKRLARVRVATLAGSIDEALQEVLLRKWAPIRKVLSQ